MFIVFIKNLVLEGIHGVTAKEQLRSQPFHIEIRAEVDAPAPGHDSVEETVDYRTMRAVVQRVVCEEQHALVETIALRIARGVRESDARIRSVSVEVSKT